MTPAEVLMMLWFANEAGLSPPDAFGDDGDRIEVRESFRRAREFVGAPAGVSIWIAFPTARDRRDVIWRALEAA